MTAPPDVAIAEALQTAALSPCAKSKRGVVAYARTDPPRVIGVGFNGPPRDIRCDGSWSCQADCGKRCVHAEVRAIRDLPTTPTLRRWIVLVHVKIGEDGRLVAGGGPSCWQCSREILDVGIGGVWLFEAQRWHDEVPCGTCNQKTVIAQGDGTDGVCKSCKVAGRLPGLLELGRSKTIYAQESGEWRFHTAADFHRATLEACGIGGPR